MNIDQTLRRFLLKDGREIVLRAPKWEDLDKFVDYINSLAREELDVLPEMHVMTREAEADWLKKRITERAKGKVLDVIAEIDGVIVANSEITVKGRSKTYACHVGELGIAIRSGYRDKGIGTAMVNLLIEASQQAGLKVLFLHVHANNTRARHVYEKAGFTETGRIPKGFFRNGKYIDDVILTKEISE